MSHPAADRIVGLYDDHAEGWIADRGDRLYDGDQGPNEGQCLDRLTEGFSPGATVLDVGCGSGRPIGAELIRRGFSVHGVDSSPKLIAHARQTLPEGKWTVGDMRALDEGGRYDGVIAWHSLFHLTPQEQEATVPRLARLVAPGGRLMFTSGPARGQDIGEWRGEPLYHGSLDPRTYRALLEGEGLDIVSGAPGDASARGWVWLARRAIFQAEYTFTIP